MLRFRNWAKYTAALIFLMVASELLVNSRSLMDTRTFMTSAPLLLAAVMMFHKNVTVVAVECVSPFLVDMKTSRGIVRIDVRQIREVSQRYFMNKCEYTYINYIFDNKYWIKNQSDIEKLLHMLNKNGLSNTVTLKLTVGWIPYWLLWTTVSICILVLYVGFTWLVQRLFGI